ncbi:MAG: diacylglycerol kinase family protein [Arcanobacterium sp.]|nr:diacylglycerol kinase family protein [Arcanobacterium sp.]
MIIGIALNPASGKGRAAKYRNQLLKVTNEYPVEVRWLTGNSAQDSLSQMKAAVSSREVDALVVVGGDGMIHLGVAAVADSGIPLGIVAAGSGNDIAREFKLPIHRIEDSLHQVIVALFANRFYRADAIEIESNSGKHYAMAVVSLGIDADINLRTNKMTWPKGNLRYIRAMIPAIREYRPYGVQIKSEQLNYRGTMTLLSVANTRFFGGGICIAPDAKPNDGWLDVILAKGMSVSRVASKLPKLARAMHTTDADIDHIRVKELFLAADTEVGQHPPSLMADGEYVCDLPAVVRVLPQVVKLAL